MINYSRLGYEIKRNLTPKKIECIIWSIISLIMLIVAVMHPRIIYCILVIICVIIDIICYRSKKKKTVGKMRKDIVENIFVILILWCFGLYLNILFPYHASYEYKNDIASLKAEASERYYYFPDKIPDLASNVEWICLPNFLQGTGYHKLFFYADESYLQKVYDTYAEYATIYTYEYLYDNPFASWANHNMESIMVLDWFPGENAIKEQERKNVQVLILYDNQDANRPRNGGIYINQVEGYVCFFAQ